MSSRNVFDLGESRLRYATSKQHQWNSLSYQINILGFTQLPLVSSYLDSVSQRRLGKSWSSEDWRTFFPMISACPAINVIYSIQHLK